MGWFKRIFLGIDERPAPVRASAVNAERNVSSLDNTTPRQEAEAKASVAEQMGTVADKPKPVPPPVTVTSPTVAPTGTPVAGTEFVVKPGEGPAITDTKGEAKLVSSALSDVQAEQNTKFAGKSATEIAADNAQKIDQLTTGTSSPESAPEPASSTKAVEDRKPAKQKAASTKRTKPKATPEAKTSTQAAKKAKPKAAKPEYKATLRGR